MEHRFACPQCVDRPWIDALADSYRGSRTTKMGNRGVDARLHAQLPLLETGRRNSLANAILATAHEPLIVLDRNLRVVAASGSFCRLFRIDAARVRAHGLHEFCSGQLES